MNSDKSIIKVTDLMKDYKSVYLEAIDKVSKMKEDTTYSERAKADMIDGLINRYTPMVEDAAARVVAQIENTQNELRTERQNAIKAGMEKAAEIGLVKKGIESGDYSADYVRDLLTIYADNPPMIEAIRAACKYNSNDEIKSIYNDIPEDETEQRIRSLEKIKNNILQAPKLADKTLAGDVAAVMWRNGSSVDSMVEFLLGMINYDAVAAAEQEQKDKLQAVWDSIHFA